MSQIRLYSPCIDAFRSKLVSLCVAELMRVYWKLDAGLDTGARNHRVHGV